MTAKKISFATWSAVDIRKRKQLLEVAQNVFNNREQFGKRHFAQPESLHALL